MPFKLNDRFDQPLQVGDLVASMTANVRPYMFLVSLYDKNRIMFGIIAKIDKKKKRRQYFVDWFVGNRSDPITMRYDEQEAMCFRDMYLTLHSNQSTL